MTNRVQTILAFVLLIGAGIGVFYYALRQPPQPAPMRLEQVVTLGKFTAVAPPRPAPAAQFMTLDGKTKRLADFQGHWLLLNLWATWCAPCINEMPALQRLSVKMGDELTVIAVAEDRKGKEAVDPFVATLQLTTLPIALDSPGMIAGALNVSGLPTTFLIDPKGRIVAKLEGAADWDDERSIRTLTDLMTAKVD